MAGASSSSTPTATRPTNIVEEIAARVNGEIITSSELVRSQAHDAQDAKDECADKKCTPEELQKMIEQGKADALRGLIDTKLWCNARGFGISAETELVRQLDQTRIENKMDSMEALQKAVESEGLDWEEYKDSVRNQFLAQDVIYREVDRRFPIRSIRAKYKNITTSTKKSLRCRKRCGFGKFW